VLHCTLVGGAILGELPTVAAQFGAALNSAGRFQVTVPLEADPPRLRLPIYAGGSTDLTGNVNLVTMANLTPGTTAVWFERDGVLLFGGVVWTAQVDAASNTMTVAGEGPHSYLRRRAIRSTLTYTAQDQLDIVRGLIDHAQTQTNGTIGITYSTADSGVTRDRTYLAYERKNVGEAIEQLAAIDGGFDWRYDHNYVAGVPTWSAQFTYPATGRTTEMVFEVGTNCALDSYEEDGTSICNLVDVFGVGTAAETLTASLSNPPMQGPYPILETTETHSDVSELNTLELHARRRLARGAGPTRRAQLTCLPGVDPVLGSYIAGDRVRVRCDHGWLQLDETMRIVDVTVNVAGGAESVSLSLAGSNVFETI